MEFTTGTETSMHIQAPDRRMEPQIQNEHIDRPMTGISTEVTVGRPVAAATTQVTVGRPVAAATTQVTIEKP
jgi:general secretion pathway protein D